MILAGLLWLFRWRVCHGDHDFLTSPHARELLRSAGIIVTDYRTIQQAWNETRTPRYIDSPLLRWRDATRRRARLGPSEART